jgi:hypothetical protein
MRAKDRRDRLCLILKRYPTVLDVPDNLWNPKGAARQPIKRSRVSKRGYFPSSKMDSQVPFESIHELNRLYLIDADPRVVAFVTQPCTLTGTCQRI